jgi:hypothetical protein
MPPPGRTEESPDQEPVDLQRPRKKLPTGLLAGVGAVVIVVIGLAFALGGGGDDGDDTDGDQATVTSTIADDATEVSEVTTSGLEGEPAVDVEGPAAGITGITVQDGRYVVEYETFGFSPQIDDPGAFHVHFFWDTLPVINAGANGPDPGAWLLWDMPFTVSDAFFDVGAKPDGARQICVVVANNAHEIADVDNDGTTDTDTGGCLDLPGA